MFQPRKPKIETDKNTDGDIASDGSDSDATVILSVNTLMDTKKEDPVLKCGMTTKNVSLKKPDLAKPWVRRRNHQCPVCKLNHGTLAALNEHYKLHHWPLTCKECEQQFCTPSALEKAWLQAL